MAKPGLEPRHLKHHQSMNPVTAVLLSHVHSICVKAVTVGFHPTTGASSRCVDTTSPKAGRHTRQESLPSPAPILQHPRQHTSHILQSLDNHACKFSMSHTDIISMTLPLC